MVGRGAAFPQQVSGVQPKEKLSHLDLKSWVTGGTTIRPGILSNLKLFESIWLNIESIELKYFPITRNPGSNFSSASDSTFKVKMTQFFLSVYKRFSRSFVVLMRFIHSWNNFMFLLISCNRASTLHTNVSCVAVGTTGIPLFPLQEYQLQHGMTASS